MQQEVIDVASKIIATLVDGLNRSDESAAGGLLGSGSDSVQSRGLELGSGARLSSTFIPACHLLAVETWPKA